MRTSIKIFFRVEESIQQTKHGRRNVVAGGGLGPLDFEI